jgi:hypothetical protein
MKILVGDFSAKVGGGDVFKPAVGNESLHKVSSGNGIRIINFATSRNVSRVQCSHIPTIVNTVGLLLMGRRTTRLIAS